MFGLSFGELLVIAVLALVLLGPERLPEAAKTLGKGLRDLRRVTEDLKDQVEHEIYVGDGQPAKHAVGPTAPVSADLEPAAKPPPATAENVPGLEAATAEPAAADAAADEAAERSEGKAEAAGPSGEPSRTT